MKVDPNSDTHGAMTCAEGHPHSHGKYDGHYHTNDGDHSAAPLDGDGTQDYSDHLAARKRRAAAMQASEGKVGRTGMGVRRVSAVELEREARLTEDDEELDETEDEQDGGELLSEYDSGMTFAAKKDGKDGKGKKAAPADDGDGEDDGDGADGEDDGEQYDDTTSPDYNPEDSSDYTMDDEPDPPEDDEEDVTDDVLEKGTPTEGTSGRASSKTAKGPGHSTKTMMPTPPATGGKKMSDGGMRGTRRMEGSMTFAELQAEVVRLRERDVQNSYKLYTRDVDDTLAKWEKGQRITLSEKDGAGKRLPTTGRIAITPAFKRAYREYMLKEGFKLSDTHRSGVQALVEQALSCAVVDLSTRGAAFDQETRRTLRDGNNPGKRGPSSAEQSKAVEAEVARLAESEGKTLSELDSAQTYSLYMRAAEAVGYR